MRPFRDFSITRKLLLIVMLTSTAALVLAGFAFAVYDQVTFRRTLVNHLSTLANVIADNGNFALVAEDDKVVSEVLGSLVQEPHIVAGCFYDKNGKVFAKYIRAGERADFPTAPLEFPQGFRFTHDSVEMAHPIVSLGDKVGMVYLKADLAELRDRLTRSAGIGSIIILASALAALVMSSLLRGAIVRPIAHLVETARMVSNGKNYAIRASKHGQDELGILIDGFNEMLQQIQQRDTELQRARDELEARVAERTGELEQEIAERKLTAQALQQQLSRISLLNQIARAISRRHDLQSILHVVLHQLEEQLPIDFGCVYLLEEPSHTLTLTALCLKDPQCRAGPGDAEGAVVAVGELGLHATTRGEVLDLPDTQQSALPLARRLAQGGLRSAQVLPLLVEDKVFGILVTARRQAAGFSQEEQLFLRMLSEHVALATHQAQLHTQLQVAYDELRQTQQAVMQQERLRALGQMASGIAHDINNSLSPVLGYASLILSRETNLSENTKKELSHILTAGQDVAQIVARMREFYRQREASEQRLPVQLNRLVGEVIELTRPRWRDIPQERGTVIEMQAQSEADLPEILGNRTELREALTNLILNSVDAMPEGGTLCVRTCALPGNHERSVRSASTQVCLEVRDTGIGMDEETRKRCLEPFFSTKGELGTGLGLAMVYGIVERHEGSIEIESAVGAGTVMRLIFPARQSNGPAFNDAPAAADHLEPLRILCIDDEPLVRQLLKDMLESQGHEVEVADGGQAGIDKFSAAQQQGRPFEVVLTDLGMPRLDGRQVVRVIKQQSPATPIIMLTGWGARMGAEGRIPAQADLVVSKPPTINKLRDALLAVKPPVAGGPTNP